MKKSFKILLNTTALYFKIVITTLVQLFSTRIAINALGIDSFGLYNLIAGIIVLLSFFNGALMISTQRFMSISIGEKKEEKLLGIFNASLFIHIILALVILLSFKLCQPFLFDGFLTIPFSLRNTAINIYSIMAISSFVTICTIPYSANINAREDMWYFALSDILGALFKLWAAISLLIFKGNLLLIYTSFMLLAIIIESLSKILWCKIKYKESKIQINLMKNRKLIYEMIGFVGWNTVGSVAVLIRNQGVAVLLNLFFGIVVNAAYGIANQVNALVLTFASTLTTVFTPSIIQSRGEGNNKRMLFIAIFSSKISFLLSSIVALPLLIYMPNILAVWLNKIPNDSVIFCRLIIISFIILQFYPGLNRAIYAVGKIKAYQISISLILISIIPIGSLAFNYGAPAFSILAIMSVLQFLTLVSTIYYAKKYINLNVNMYLTKSIITPSILFIIILTVGFILCKTYSNANSYLFIILSSIFYCCIYMITYYKYVFSFTEKELLNELIKNLYNKIKLNQ